MDENTEKNTERKKPGRQKGQISEKQMVFIQEYVKCWNGTQAAKLAGYGGPAASGSRLLKYPHIRGEINRIMQARNVEVEATVDNIIKELSDIGFAKMGVKDTDKIKALDLLGRKFGLWDGPTGKGANKDRKSNLEGVLSALEKHSGGTTA